MSVRSISSYLLESYGRYFFRMRVPTKLQPILGKRELKKAIRTTDRTLAERQAIVYAAKAIELFDSLQERTLADFPFFTSMVLNRLIVEPNGLVTIEGLKMDPDKPEAEKAMFNTVISEAKALAASSVPNTKPTELPSKKLMLSEAVDKFMEHRQKKSENRKSVFDEKAARLPFKLLTEFLGGDKPVEDISEADADKFYNDLKRLPVIRTGKAYRGWSFREFIAMKNVECIDANTHGQHLGKISGLWNYLYDKKILTIENPFFGMADKKVMHAEAGIKKRQPFNAEDIKKIFRHSIWTEKKFDDVWEYWLPLLLIHTGARVNEIVQLEKKDVLTIDGIQCLSINDIPTKDEPDSVWKISPKRIKTANSRREIPIHSKLIELGFLDFVDSVTSGRLFPDIEPIARKLAATPCKRFNETLLIEMGVKVTKKKTFYSLRHTVMHALKTQRVVPEERGQLAGHSPQQSTRTTELYGDIFPLEDMQALVQRLDFTEAVKDVIPWPKAQHATKINVKLDDPDNMT